MATYKDPLLSSGVSISKDPLKPDAEAKSVMQTLRKTLEKKASGKVPITPFNPKRL